jgi:hypothetical protein
MPLKVANDKLNNLQPIQSATGRLGSTLACVLVPPLRDLVKAHVRQ